jgi:hypothetical protein
MRQRVHDTYTDQEFAELYGEPWQQASPDHPHLAHCPNPWVYWDLMVAVGTSFADVTSLADLSCGDGRIARAIGAHYGVDPVLGDLAPGYEHQGFLAETVPKLGVVDLYVCTNTVEHLEDPDGDLTLIREHCTELLLATPVEEWTDADNGHYWAWDREGVEEMLMDTGFQVSAYVELDLTPYWNPHCKHGIWACR